MGTSMEHVGFCFNDSLNKAMITKGCSIVGVCNIEYYNIIMRKKCVSTTESEGQRRFHTVLMAEHLHLGTDFQAILVSICGPQLCKCIKYSANITT